MTNIVQFDLVMNINLGALVTLVTGFCFTFIVRRLFK